MPMFDYLCPACGQLSEALLRRSTDAGPKVCPSCGTKGLKRMLSAPHVIVKQEAGAECKSCSSRSATCTTGACAKGIFPDD